MEKHKLFEKKSQINPRFFIREKEDKTRKTLGALMTGIGLVGSLYFGNKLYDEAIEIENEKNSVQALSEDFYKITHDYRRLSLSYGSCTAVTTVGLIGILSGWYNKENNKQ